MASSAASSAPSVRGNLLQGSSCSTKEPVHWLFLVCTRKKGIARSGT